jgi:hypothetical protein
MESGFIALSSELALTGYYFLLLLVVTILLVNSTYNPFIYFRF